MSAVVGTSQVEQMFNFLVSGIIINDPNGPRCWSEWFEAPTALRADELAREKVWAMTADGLHGILFVANIFQLSVGADGELGIQQVDTYAAYADDPHRQLGVAPEAGWHPPVGFEGRARPVRMLPWQHGGN